LRRTANAPQGLDPARGISPSFIIAQRVGL
jgi:hypothetical protein